MADEFEHFSNMRDILGRTSASAKVVLGIGNNKEIARWPGDHDPVQSEDVQLVAGHHYPGHARADLIGYRSMAVAASGLAAKGATPSYATVSLVTPTLSLDYGIFFANGIILAARDFGLKVYPGKLAQGPQCVTVTMYGHAPAGQKIQRSGAEDGDYVYVTGALGGASLAQKDAGLATASLLGLTVDSPLRRYWKPAPHIKFAERLRTIATAAIEISDSLAADLEHLCQESKVCCEVDLDKVPLFPGAKVLEAVVARDDYELAFTAPPACEASLCATAAEACVPVSRIGTVYACSPPVACWSSQGRRIDIQVPAGYLHF